MKRNTSRKGAVPKTITVKNANGTNSRFARKGSGTTKAQAEKKKESAANRCKRGTVKKYGDKYYFFEGPRKKNCSVPKR